VCLHAALLSHNPYMNMMTPYVTTSFVILFLGWYFRFVHGDAMITVDAEFRVPVQDCGIQCHLSWMGTVDYPA
jgi:hypothetical protein